MKERKEKGLLVVITGPKGVGKDCVIKELGFNKIISCTTRSPRPDEIDGRDYHFISQEEFLRMCEKGEFMEKCKYPGCGETEYEYKGTPFTEIQRLVNGENLVWRVAPSLAAKAKDVIRDSFPDKAEGILANAYIFYIGTPSLRELSHRLVLRDNGSVSREDRNKIIRREWEAWTKHKNEFEYVVINDTGYPDKTAMAIMDIINTGRRS